MRIDVVTIFPDLIRAALGFSIVKRAREAGVVEVQVHDLRDWAPGVHRSTDETPYGGGAGMVMRPGPLFDCVESLPRQPGSRIALLTPQGERFSQAKARELSLGPHLVLICGHYEGFDERVREHLATEEISVGDYVLTGGELPALIVIDAVTRLQPSVLGRLIGVPALYAPARLPGLARSRCSALRPPCRDRQMATQGAVPPHASASARPLGGICPV
jgi:tRNA (guanine37-N1)-methyltransferase